MSSYPIYEKPMNSAQRSRRSILQQRQELSDIRACLEQSAGMHLDVGRQMSANGNKAEAAEHFRMAEMQMHYYNAICRRLAPYEKEIHWTKLPDRRGLPAPSPEERLLLTAENKQRTYAASRAAWKPAIDARYGHLAKAEKAEVE